MPVNSRWDPNRGQWVGWQDPEYKSLRDDTGPNAQPAQTQASQPAAPIPTALQSGSSGYGGSGGDGSGNGLNSSALFQQAAGAADPWAPQRAQYTTQLNNLMQGGVSAVANDPSVMARQQAGEQALSRSAAARGFLGSGNILSEIQKQGQDIASQEYGNQFNRLSKLAGVDSGSPSSAGNIMAQAPGQNLQEQQTGFNQAVTAQKLPYELTALQQGSQIGAQNIATGGLEQQMLQQQMQQNKSAQDRLSLVKNQPYRPQGMFV